MQAILKQAFLAYFEAEKINISDTGSTYDLIMLNCPFSDFSPHISIIADSVFDLDRYTHVAINKQDLYIIFQ